MGIIKPPIESGGNVAGGFGPGPVPSGESAALFGGAGVEGVGGIAVDRGETCVITVYNVATVTLRVNVRIAIPQSDKAGRVAIGKDPYQILTKVVVPTTAGAVNTFTIPLFKGFVQSVFVSALTGTPGATDTYCEIGLASNGVTRADQFAVLLAGFVTAQYALSSSYTQNNSIQGQGALTLVSGSGTATASIVNVIPASNRYIMRSGYMTLTTSATAGNRRLRLRQLRPSASTIIWEAPSHVNQAASLTYIYLFGDYDTDTAVDTMPAGDVIARTKVPEQIFYAGDGFNIVFDNNQAGDTMAYRFQFETWITG